MDPKTLVSLAESLRGANLRRYAPEEIEKRLLELLVSYQALAIGRSEHQIWYRGRLCPTAEGFSNLYDCIYPKADLVRDFGRANYPNEPVFYASWNETVVVGELRSEPGQFVHIIAIRPKKGVEIPCHIVGEIEHIAQSGISLVNSPRLVAVVERMLRDSPEEECLRRVFVDAFLADQFSRRVERPYEYKLTATYARRLFAGSGGIMYPSVEVRGGINLAISAPVFDENFEVIWALVFEVKDYYGYGVYDLAPKRFTCEFDENGTIRWDSKRNMGFQVSIQQGKRPVGEIRGWTVAK